MKKTYADTLRGQYPDRLPIICTWAKSMGGKPCKFLVEPSYTMAQFMMMVKKPLKLSGASEALYFFVNGQSVGMSSTISEIYAQHKNPTDGMLYLVYDYESTFG